MFRPISPVDGVKAYGDLINMTLEFHMFTDQCTVSLYV